MIKPNLIIHSKDVVDYYVREERMMSSGSEGGERRMSHAAFDDALKALSYEVSMLEKLLEDIQGSTSPPSAVEVEKKAVEPVIPLMLFLREGEDRIQRITERIIMAKNGIREAIF